MAPPKAEIKVGLTVVVATIIFLAGLLWIKGYRYGRHYYTVSVLFPDVGNLETGDPVSVNGVRRGKVEAIKLYEGQVLVTVTLGNDVILKSDAEFAVKNIGLMGERFIDVRPGKSNDTLNISQPIHGYYDTGIPEVMGVLGRMVNETRELVAAIRSTLASDSTLSTFVQTVENVDRLTNQLEGTVVENRARFARAIEDFAATARTLREFTKSNQAQIDRTVDQFDSASAVLVSFSGRLDTLSQSLMKIMSQVEQGQGTLGLMLDDDELYNELKTAAQDLEVLLTDIRTNPKKYLQVQVKLF
jgi:phospholipid/cholesterol/gamma-HCH transport system substrate-binding protein